MRIQKATAALIAVTAIALVTINVFAAEQIGKIQLCRRPGIIGLTDGKKVDIPAENYTGSCDKAGENCRSGIKIRGAAAVLGPSAKACVILEAELLVSDGGAIKVGEQLLPQWSIPGFEPVIRVVTPFK